MSDNDDDDLIKCWCGAEGTFGEMFSEEPYHDSCGGSGVINCECGGSFCV